MNQKQPHNVEVFKYLGRVISNYTRYTFEINSRIVMAKALFKKHSTLSKQIFDEETVLCLFWVIIFMVLNIKHFGK
jgi:hypothetical protein